MKYILTKQNYFSHVGTDPVENAVPLDFDKNFSIENMPCQFHYWNGEEFVLDKDMYKVSLVDRAKQMVFAYCDILQEKLVKNESYSYKADYAQTKQQLLNQLKTQRARLTTFDALTIAELEEITYQKVN